MAQPKSKSSSASSSKSKSKKPVEVVATSKKVTKAPATTPVFTKAAPATTPVLAKAAAPVAAKPVVSAAPAPARELSRGEFLELVRKEAYRRATHRNFKNGSPFQDWLNAEAAVSGKLAAEGIRLS